MYTGKAGSILEGSGIYVHKSAKNHSKKHLTSHADSIILLPVEEIRRVKYGKRVENAVVRCYDSDRSIRSILKHLNTIPFQAQNFPIKTETESVP